MLLLPVPPLVWDPGWGLSSVVVGQAAAVLTPWVLASACRDLRLPLFFPFPQLLCWVGDTVLQQQGKWHEHQLLQLLVPRGFMPLLLAPLSEVGCPARVMFSVSLFVWKEASLQKHTAMAVGSSVKLLLVVPLALFWSGSNSQGLTANLLNKEDKSKRSYFQDCSL